MRRAAVVALATIVAVVLVTSMHPLTPARTFSAYELKARGTAKSALSSVETARLAAKVGADGSAFGSYVSVVLSEAEGGLTHASDTFAGIQPPDRRSDRLRQRLVRMLTDAQGRVSQLRITARRGDLDGLGRQTRALARLAERLDAFVERH